MEQCADNFNDAGWVIYDVVAKMLSCQGKANDEPAASELIIALGCKIVHFSRISSEAAEIKPVIGIWSTRVRSEWKKQLEFERPPCVQSRSHQEGLDAL